MQLLAYIIPIFLMLLYYELLGQVVSNYFKINFKSLYIPLGFAITQEFSYFFTSIISFINADSFILYTIQILFFLISLYLIIKNKTYKHIYIRPFYLLFIAITTFFLLYYAFNTTLGDLHGFDTTYYLNFMSQNIGIKGLNSINTVWGSYQKGSIEDLYSFQSYFYYASFLMFIFQKGYSFLKISFYPAIEFIWLFQTVFFILLTNLICETIAAYKSHQRKICLYFIAIAFLVIFYGRYQYNSVYGFYGNTLRTIMFAYVCLYTYSLFKTGDKNYRFLIYLFILAACSLSSSGTFISLLFLFAFFYVFSDKEKKILKEYAVIVFPILVNIIQYVIKQDVVIAIIASLIISVLLYVFNDLITSLYKRYKIIILVLVILFMTIMSYKVTGKLFDLSGLLSSVGMHADMVLFYFNFSKYTGLSIKNIYIVYTALIVIINLLFKRKDKLIIIDWILIICFFNPFCCNFLNKINIVYYRALEIILNPFTLIYMTNNLFDLVNNKKISYIVSIGICLLMLYTGNLSKPLYYHISYIPDEDYNGFYKMNNDEFDIINELKNYCLDKSNPKIVTPNLLTQSMLQKGTYLQIQTGPKQNKKYMLYFILSLILVILVNQQIPIIKIMKSI